MLLSLLTRRFTLGAIAARTPHTPSLAIATRRSLFATPRFAYPATDASLSTEKKAKKGRPAKSQKKEPKKQRVRVPRLLKPPKRALSPYMIFFSSFVKDQPAAHTLQEAQEISKRAGQIWKGYSMAEKQQYYDEGVARAAQANKERADFFHNMSSSDLRQLNAIRKVQGKPRFHPPGSKGTGPPPNAFILFLNEFRNTAAAQNIGDEIAPEKRQPVRVVLAAAARWKSMSQEEKTPYFERHNKEKEEFNAQRTES